MLVEAHLSPPSARGRAPVTGSEIGLRFDHALMDAGAAALVFQYLESRAASALALEATLACVEGPVTPASFEGSEELLYVQSAARRLGSHFSPPGGGRAHHIYVASAAAPGRALLSCADLGVSAGAAAQLVLPASELEMAAALTGIPHVARLPEVWAIRLVGTLPPGVVAQDLVLKLMRILPGAGRRAVALEYCGPGVATLDQEARFTVAREGAAAGLPPALFPSDEHTRAWLKAQGREPEWKPLAGNPESDSLQVIEIHLDELEPRLARTSEGSDPLDVRELTGLPAQRVVVGADAGLADLVRFAEALDGQPAAPGVELFVVPGSRQIRATLAASGALAALVAAGAKVLDAETRLPPGGVDTVALLCGTSPTAAGHARTVLRTGPAIAAASALSGRIADPRELAPPAARYPLPERYLPDGVEPPWPPAERPALEIVRGTTMQPLPPRTPLPATLRGVVLQRFPDRVSTEQALPRGPRVWRHHGDLGRLAASLFAGLDPTFAARARALGGGIVVAGSEYGVGPHRAHLVPALVALGIRAVIAESFAPAHRAELIRHGVLPLRPAPDTDPGELALGDELEFPGLRDMLERNKPLVARDLTRGTQVTLHHDLGTREIELIRAGGLLPSLASLASLPGRAATPA
jgi:aconitate hydratase